MSGKEHLSLYKSKSGNHLLPTSHRERFQEEKKKTRNKERHAAFAAHRSIEKTPQKNLPSADQPKEQAQKNKNLLDRKKMFMERFQQYRDKKTKATSETKKVIPFVSSVPSGRFVTANPPQPAATTSKAPAIRKKIEVKNVGLKNVAVTPPSIVQTPTSRRFRIDRVSPINTRSRKFLLLSPSQLPTPTRKRKSGASCVAVKNVPKKVKRVIALTAAKNRPTTSSKALATKVKVTQVASSTAQKTAEAPVVKAKPKITATVSRPAIQAKKPATVTKSPASKPFTINEVPEIPSKFDFTTSTAVKSRPSVVVPVRSRSNSAQLFNESISPIENGTPKPQFASAQKATKASPPVLEEIKDENETPVKPEAEPNTSVNYVSPFVTISRGKHRSNKEREARETKYKLTSRMSVDLNESTEDRQNKEAAIYFRLQIKNETERLLALVEKWTAIKEDDAESIPSEYVDQIDVAIGQTRLLINSKFTQFSGLVDKCEAAVAMHSVRPEDLEGFWGMVYIQVENCNKRFDRLDVLKANDWQDPDIKVTKTKKIKANGAITKAKAKTIKPNSVLMEMLMKARKKVMESKENKETQIGVVGPVFSLSRRKSLLQNRSSNFSPAKRSSTPSKGTPRKTIWIVSIHYANILNSTYNLAELNSTFCLVLHLQVEEQNNRGPAAPTPQRGILKTPGSMRKAGSVNFLNKSPQVLFFNKEKEIGADLSAN